MTMLVSDSFALCCFSAVPGWQKAFLFGKGKGSGARLPMFLMWILGITVCLLFMSDGNIKNLSD